MSITFVALVILLMTLLVTFSVSAHLNIYHFDDEVKAAQFYHLISELRCPKCQNNNLADSNAPLATDIKKYVYREVEKGARNDQITDFLVSRYGEFITYRPRNRAVWIVPTAIGCFAFCISIAVIRRKRSLHDTSGSIVEASPPSLDMKTIIRDYEDEKSSLIEKNGQIETGHCHQKNPSDGRK